MSPNFNPSEVAYLLRARKFIYRTLQETDAFAAPSRLVLYDVRRRDNPGQDLQLKLTARQVRPVRLTSFKLRPTIALTWHGYRIRGVSRRIKHDDIRNGVVVGQIRGWYEHQWSTEDGDKHIIDVNDVFRQEDFQAVLATCCERWNIEYESPDVLDRLLF